MKSGKMENVSAKQSMLKSMVFADLAHPTHGLHLMALNASAKKIIIGIPKHGNVMKFNVLPTPPLFTKSTNTDVNAIKAINGGMVNVFGDATGTRF